MISTQLFACHVSFTVVVCAKYSSDVMNIVCLVFLSIQRIVCPSLEWPSVIVRDRWQEKLWIGLQWHNMAFYMMGSSNGNIFRLIDPLWGEWWHWSRWSFNTCFFKESNGTCEKGPYVVGEVFPWGGNSVIFSVCASISRTGVQLHEIDIWLDPRSLNEYYGALMFPKVNIIVT